VYIEAAAMTRRESPRMESIEQLASMKDSLQLWIFSLLWLININPAVKIFRVKYVYNGDLITVMVVISALCCSDWCSHWYVDQWTSLSDTWSLWLGSSLWHCPAASASACM